MTVLSTKDDGRILLLQGQLPAIETLNTEMPFLCTKQDMGKGFTEL